MKQKADPGTPCFTTALAVGAAVGLFLAAGREWLGSPDEWASFLSFPIIISLLAALQAGSMVASGGPRDVAVAALASCLVWWGWRREPQHAEVAGIAPVAAMLLGYLVSGLMGLPRRGTARAESEAEAQPGTASGSAWLVLPTYNEAENIRALLTALRSVAPEVHLVVVDDNSPDGTAELVRAAANGDPMVHLLLRTEDRGLDRAWLAGFQTALDAGAEAVLTMDADFSHDPNDVPRLLAALGEADMAIGSRYVPGGRTENWPWYRKVLSAAANAYARYVLELTEKDCSSGYRAYRAAALRQLLEQPAPRVGYALLEVLLFRAERRGLRITEVPILFHDRRAGGSKMTLHQAWNGMRVLWRVGNGSLKS